MNPDLAADTAAIIQPGMRVRIPPFTEACGEGVAVQKPVTGNCNAYSVQARGADGGSGVALVEVYEIR